MTDKGKMLKAAGFHNRSTMREGGGWQCNHCGSQEFRRFKHKRYCKACGKKNL